VTADATALVPPRPNPGPEPFAEPRPTWGWLAGLSFTVGLLAFWALNRRRQRARRTLERPSETIAPGLPQEPLVALAESVRAALVARFGASWRAKTTEEIASDAAPADAFGVETAERLVTLLREADRAKFAATDAAGSGSQRDDVDAWMPWVAEFLAEAGATSRISGK